jgi:hypothetical protein
MLFRLSLLNLAISKGVIMQKMDTMFRIKPGNKKFCTRRKAPHPTIINFTSLLSHAKPMIMYAIPIRLNMAMFSTWFVSSLKFKNQFNILPVNTMANSILKIVKNDLFIFPAVVYKVIIFLKNAFAFSLVHTRARIL